MNQESTTFTIKSISNILMEETRRRKNRAKNEKTKSPKKEKLRGISHENQSEGRVSFNRISFRSVIYRLKDRAKFNPIFRPLLFNTRKLLYLTNLQ